MVRDTVTYYRDSFERIDRYRLKIVFRGNGEKQK